MWGTTETLTDDSLVTQHFFLRVIKNKRKRKRIFPIYIELKISKSSIGFGVKSGNKGNYKLFYTSKLHWLLHANQSLIKDLLN